MTPAARQILFINTAHTITHYSLLILPTAVLAMAVPGGLFGEFTAGSWRSRRACSYFTAYCRCHKAGWCSGSVARR